MATNDDEIVRDYQRVNKTRFSAVCVGCGGRRIRGCMCKPSGGGAPGETTASFIEP